MMMMVMSMLAAIAPTKLIGVISYGRGNQNCRLDGANNSKRFATSPLGGTGRPDDFTNAIALKAGKRVRSRLVGTSRPDDLRNAFEPTKLHVASRMGGTGASVGA